MNDTTEDTDAAQCSVTSVTVTYTIHSTCSADSATERRFSEPWTEAKGYGNRRMRRSRYIYSEPPQWDRPRSERPQLTRADRKRLKPRRRKRERTVGDER